MGSAGKKLENLQALQQSASWCVRASANQHFKAGFDQNKTFASPTSIQRENSGRYSLMPTNDNNHMETLFVVQLLCFFMHKP